VKPELINKTAPKIIAILLDTKKKNDSSMGRSKADGQTRPGFDRLLIPLP